MATQADRILEASFGDRAGLEVVRLLAKEDLSQSEIVGLTGQSQSTVSRTTKSLRLAGVVDWRSPRGKLFLRFPQETRALLMAVERLAEACLAADQLAQQAQSRDTRRTAIKSTSANVGSA